MSGSYRELERIEAEKARARADALRPTQDVRTTQGDRSTIDDRPTDGERPTESVVQTPAVLRTDDVPRPRRSPKTVQSVAAPDPVPPTPIVQATPRVLVEFKDGYLQLPHWFEDNLLPQLEPNEQLVYLRLYRLSHGHGRDWCVVSTPKLSESTRIKHTALFIALKRLESRQLIERLKTIVAGRAGGQGNRYRVNLPTVIRPTEGIRGTDRDASTPDVRTTTDAVMKENPKDMHESLSVFDVRSKAARLLEEHRHSPDFDAERLRELVSLELFREGKTVSDDVIVEATRGMA